ncbi:hypothetical protein EZV62_001648 [Acer yangbiense]|uniref:Uncharacterized protein n=1 Tax=Acer yangbiense TaxID=1000413 RepID=A0A5C7IVE3_9ROSI|nr:hypothetical protein EZV62_001648 [Acer yangbiense]
MFCALYMQMALFPWKVYDREKSSAYYKSLMLEDVVRDDHDHDDVEDRENAMEEGAAPFTKAGQEQGDVETPKSKFKTSVPYTIPELYTSIAQLVTQLIKESEERMKSWITKEIGKIAKERKEKDLDEGRASLEKHVDDMDEDIISPLHNFDDGEKVEKVFSKKVVEEAGLEKVETENVVGEGGVSVHVYTRQTVEMKCEQFNELVKPTKWLSNMILLWRTLRRQYPDHSGELSGSLNRREGDRHGWEATPLQGFNLPLRDTWVHGTWSMEETSLMEMEPKTEWLDRKQVIFDEVVEGFDILKAIDKIGSSSGFTSKPAGIFHGEDPGTSVLVYEVFISETIAIYGLTSESIEVSQVSSYEHRVGKHVVEDCSLVVEWHPVPADSLLASAESPNILRCYGGSVGEKLNRKSTCRMVIDVQVKEHSRVRLSTTK